MNYLLDSRPVLTLAQAQAIAESIVGPVEWNGPEGYCTCPGIERHTSADSHTDCSVVAETTTGSGGTALPPGVYCFHDSCGDECDMASLALRSTLGKATPYTGPRIAAPKIQPKPKPVFSPEKLEAVASKLPPLSLEWFALRSRKAVHNRTPASFLRELYLPGERVLVFDTYKSQGQALWEHDGYPFDAGELDEFRTGCPDGVWFLANPVTGEYAPRERKEPSRRSAPTVTSWRYLVLESDKADPGQWLSALAQMPLPIAAIYSSGGKSIHALVKLDAGSKEEWDATAEEIKAATIPLGADRKAISAVRLTRLPMCMRYRDGEGVAYPGGPRLQQLIYLNGAPECVPLCELPHTSPSPIEIVPADQDGMEAA